MGVLHVRREAVPPKGTPSQGRALKIPAGTYMYTYVLTVALHSGGMNLALMTLRVDETTSSELSWRLLTAAEEETTP